MSALHPKIKMPLWVALALPAAAYVVRSAFRGFDFRPDVPLDLIALAAFGIVFGLAVWSRRMAAKLAEEERSGEEHDEDDSA